MVNMRHAFAKYFLRGAVNFSGPYMTAKRERALHRRFTGRKTYLIARRYIAGCPPAAYFGAIFGRGRYGLKPVSLAGQIITGGIRRKAHPQ
jgi:hypothetical protein